MTTNEFTLHGLEDLKVPRSTARTRREADQACNKSHQRGITQPCPLIPDPSPSCWLAAECLKMPLPPSRLRTQVRNCVTYCFEELSCISATGSGQEAGSLSPGTPLVHAAHSPTAGRCPRVSVQLSTLWAPSCQRVEYDRLAHLVPS